MSYLHVAGGCHDAVLQIRRETAWGSGPQSNQSATSALSTLVELMPALVTHCAVRRVKGGRAKWRA